MFWKVQACRCEFLTCYSSSWKPKINKKRREICAAPAGSDRVIRQRPIKRKSVRGEKKIWRFKKICKEKTALHYHPAWAPTQNEGTFTFMQADRSSPRWWIPPLKDNVDPSVHFPPPVGWCSTADELCWFWFGALGWAHWIKWHRKHTGTSAGPATQVPGARCLSATLHTHARDTLRRLGPL